MTSTWVYMYTYYIDTFAHDSIRVAAAVRPGVFGARRGGARGRAGVNCSDPSSATFLHLSPNVIFVAPTLCVNM